MSLPPIAHIPGLPPDAARVLIEYLNAQRDDINKALKAPRVTELKTGSVLASEGESVRIKGRNTVTLPRARASNQGITTTVMLEDAGPLRVVADGGSLINGASSFAAAAPGRYEFESNGSTGWFCSSTGSGSSGSQGARGATGATGTTGATGQQGPPGYDGEDGHEGMPGASGQRGAQGAQGFPGMDGRDGDDGYPGPPGERGARGLPGCPGMPGYDGEDGRDGIPGFGNPVFGAVVIGPQGGASTFGPQAARTVIANATNAPAAPTAVQGTVARHVFRVNDAATGLEWGDPVQILNSAGADLGDVFSLRFNAGTNTTASVSASGGFATIAINVDDFPLSGFADILANSVVCNPTALAAPPVNLAMIDNSVLGRAGSNINDIGIQTNSILGRQSANVLDITMAANTMLTRAGGDIDDLAISTHNFPARIAGNIVSHPFSTLAGNGLAYDTGALGLVVTGNNHIRIVAGTEELIWRKSRNRHFFFDDFDYVQPAVAAGDFTLAVATTAGRVLTGAGSWGIIATSAAGQAVAIEGVNNHPGILQIVTGNTGGDGIGIYRGQTVDTGFVIGSDVYGVEAVCRLFLDTDVLFRFGLVQVATLAAAITEGAFFELDHPTDNTVHTITTVTPGAAGDITNSDTGTDPGTGWNVYTILQETVGTFDFHIDDVLETTHTTDIPSGQPLNLYIFLNQRTDATAKSVDIDYVWFETDTLGARTA